MLRSQIKCFDILCVIYILRVRGKTHKLYVVVTAHSPVNELIYDDDVSWLNLLPE